MMPAVPAYHDIALSDGVRQLARPLTDAADLDDLVRRLSRARIVMLGEASHGTHEYYASRRS